MIPERVGILILLFLLIETKTLKYIKKNGYKIIGTKKITYGLFIKYTYIASKFTLFAIVIIYGMKGKIIKKNMIIWIKFFLIDKAIIDKKQITINIGNSEISIKIKNDWLIKQDTTIK